MNSPLRFFVIGMINLALRLVFSLYTSFGLDEFWIYRKSLKLLSGILPTTGGPIFYTATELPGSLFPLLVGTPLFLSNGDVIGSALFCGLLNFISALITYQLMKELFPKINRFGLYVFILFAPWGILFTNIWNPSFLHPFAAIFFYSLWRTINNPRSFWAAFGMSFSLICVLQIHLSFVLFVGITVISVLLKIIKAPNFKGLLTGGALGTVFLIPYVIEKLNQNESLFGFLSSNTNFQFKTVFLQLKELPSFFLRYASFPTGETTRFFASGKGVLGVIELMNQHLWLWPFFIFGFSLSLVMLFTSFRFYFRKWTLSLGHYKTAHQKFELLAFIIPLMTAASFLFSVKNPSAHTFWILYPISFYALLWCWQKLRSKLKPQYIRPLFVTYLISVTIYSIAGYRLTQKGILKTVPNEAPVSSFSPADSFFDTDSVN